MAITKTPYGLVYNEDGSLCYTERPDDVPFDGVTSWAVEEGTENLRNPDITQGNHTNVTIYKDAIYNNYTFRVESNGNYNADRFIIIDGAGFTAAENEQFTTSFIAKAGELTRIYIEPKAVDNNNHVTYLGTDGFDLSTGTVVINSHGNAKIRDLGGGWYYCYTTTVPMPSNTVQFHWHAFLQAYGYPTVSQGDGLWVANLQLEKKPFATSFVDGTRAKGNLVLPTILKDGMVLNFWFKRGKGIPNGYNNGYLLTTYYGDLLHTIWINDFSENRFVVNYKNNSGSTVRGINYNENVWNMFTLIVHDSKLTYHVNGDKKDEITTDDVNPFRDPISFGGRYGIASYTSFLFANIYYGYYRDKNGNVIWTDEYIKNLYHMRKPFNSRVLKGGR